MLSTLVHSLSLPALECLVVDHAFQRPVALAALTNQLSKLCAKLPLTLQILKWINLTLGTAANLIPSTAGTMARAPSVMSSVLGPLLRFTDLSHIEVELCMASLHFTDDCVIRLATAWPNIQTLRIIRIPHHVSTESIAADDLHPTIATLATFAQCCPKLSSLTLPSLDFSSIRLMTEFPVAPRHALKRLSIAVVICGDSSPVQITVALDRLFPELDVDHLWVRHAPSSGTTGSATSDWAFQSQIREILEALQSARKREKMHVKLLEAAAE